ncbi:hypothetical protein FBU59_005576 [Linderina macrospora]|uniref:Uncharacterized protein n=1 Tax=Linderina macrospora TaxID=4868 RepID=A0ACC1J287_9FUNG|nr:hypothetical protein FBU59_005576 [Linderina macrospora]
MGLFDNAFASEKLDPKPDDSEEEVEKKAKDCGRSDALTTLTIVRCMTEEIASRAIDKSPSDIMECLYCLYGSPKVAPRNQEIIDIMTMKQGPTETLYEYLQKVADNINKLLNKSLTLEKAALAMLIYGMRPECSAQRDNLLSIQHEMLEKKDTVEMFVLFQRIQPAKAQFK